MSSSVETDYLVIGAGAAGMAFTDTLIDADPNVDVIMTDAPDRIIGGLRGEPR